MSAGAFRAFTLRCLACGAKHSPLCDGHQEAARVERFLADVGKLRTLTARLHIEARALCQAGLMPEQVRVHATMSERAGPHLAEAVAGERYGGSQ